jgi:hypothetical protein
MILTTLVFGDNIEVREAAIAAAIDPAVSTMLILEGLHRGNARDFTIGNNPNLQINRIVPGCPCCIGNLTMRVTLNRILRQRPARLYISVAANEHQDQFRRFIKEAPYHALLKFTEDLYT